MCPPLWDPQGFGVLPLAGGSVPPFFEESVLGGGGWGCPQAVSPTLSLGGGTTQGWKGSLKIGGTPSTPSQPLISHQPPWGGLTPSEKAEGGTWGPGGDTGDHGEVTRVE